MRVLFTAVLMALVFPVSAQQGTETVEALTVTVGANHAPPTGLSRVGSQRAYMWISSRKLLIGWAGKCIIGRRLSGGS